MMPHLQHISVNIQPLFHDCVFTRRFRIPCEKEGGRAKINPHEETLEKLEKRGITPFRTDQDGTVVIGSDGDTLYCATEKSGQELTAKRQAA